jgi:hypothetical protein
VEITVVSAVDKMCVKMISLTDGIYYKEKEF